MEVFAVKFPRKTQKFDLFKTVVSSGFQFLDRDIVVVSSKFVSISEGSMLNLKHVKPSKKSQKIAHLYSMDKRIVEIVLREADRVLSAIPGFLLTIKDGMLAPNAGIDKSNSPRNHVILYPRKPFESADRLRTNFLHFLGMNVGIVISDSRLMPTRIGTTGIAIGVSGFEPVEDLRGHQDLFGHELQVTFKATADDLATIAVFCMGEADESVPVVVVRGATVKFSRRKLNAKDLTVDPRTDIYLRNLNSDKFVLVD